MLCGLINTGGGKPHESVPDLLDEINNTPWPCSLALPDKDELSRRFVDLQREIQDNKVDWYVVPSEDAHQSEEVSTFDKRREWITGFTGSAGTALVPASSATSASTSGKGLLFVDPRYWIQAGQEVDGDRWEIMKVGTGEGSVGWIQWAMGQGGRVGIDPRLIGADVICAFGTAESLSSRLDASGGQLVAINTNLIDKIRGDDSSPPSNPITHHPISFSGETTASKLSRVRASLASFPATSSFPSSSFSSSITRAAGEYIYILPSLPTIAWLLNIRCQDVIPYCPVAFAYVVLTSDSCVAFIDGDQLEEGVKKDWEEAGVEVEKYGVKEVGDHVASLIKKLAKIEGDEKGKKEVRVLGAEECSWALSKACEPAHLRIIQCPVKPLQALKNETEQQGMRNAYLRDGRAYVRWISWLEGKLLKEKREVGEWAAAMALGRYRRSEENFAGLAYEDISASGPNGALPHYAPQRGKDRPIDPDTTYVIDSGAQYLDGTIDTTRTIYFGEKPSDEIKRAYTRVLQGHIAVSGMQFPRGMRSDWLNMAARAPLYRDELDFEHGTGHGVGSYMGVHEYPVSYPHNFSFAPGHVTTIEPGYYKEGEFGIRIENLLLCREKQEEEPKEPEPEKPSNVTKREKKWLEWERVTQVPIQTSLVDWTLTTKDEIRWLNAHNTAVEEALTPLLEGDEDAEARDWVKKVCKPKKIWPWTGA